MDFVKLKRLKIKRLKFRQILFALVVLGLVEGGGFLAYTFCKEAPDKHAVVQAQSEPPLPEQLGDEAEIDGHIRQIFGQHAERYSVYFLRPNEVQTPYIFNDHPDQSASLIKVFILAKAMQDVHDGKESLATQLKITKPNIVGGAGVLTAYQAGKTRTLEELLKIMITESDNTATNILMDHFGADQINAYLQQNGYTETILQHKMMIGNGGKANLTSVKDVGMLLYRIYHRQCVGPEEDAFMEDILLGQTDKECFPTALPDWKIAHKTGEITGAYHDGGILRRGDDGVILVVMSNHWRDRADTMKRLRQAAQYLAAQVKNSDAQ